MTLFTTETTIEAYYNTTTRYLINATNVTQYYDCKLRNSVDSVFGSSGNYIASSVVGIAILVVIVAYTRCCAVCCHCRVGQSSCIFYCCSSSIFLSTNQQWKNLRGASKDEEEVRALLKWYLYSKGTGKKIVASSFFFLCYFIVFLFGPCAFGSRSFSCFV